ncbi:MAG: zinc-dependent metalloprotease [Bacteroidota bacterium]
MKRSFLLLIGLMLGASVLAQLPSIKDKTKGFTKSEGFFTYYHDEAKDELWLEVDAYNEEFIYVTSLAAGVGSNDIGLDRSQLSGTRIVYFERRGPKLLLVQPNLDYIAKTDNELERKSVAEAFASSVLWGFKIEAQSGSTVLVNITAFIMRDAHGVVSRLRNNREGSYKVDKTRSALYPEGSFNFPKNTEFEALLTFTGSNPGRYVRSVVPTSSAITVRQHHSFVEAPDDKYESRKMDPRSGYFGISYQDYGTPIDEPLVKRFISRHRLEKKNPDAEVSEAVEPIVYYLDNGTPEPVRSALLEGARWWNQAFEAAGYKDAFQVRVLPDDAHPLDIRYNVINWVHRSTRGWSYGSSVTDPRTGEIIKGNVLLGSLRVRQDFMIAEGLLSPYADESKADPRMKEMALARIRQLSAHEVGHTLGISHNFASSVNGRESVMDYPHPKVDIKNGGLDLSDAYDVGIGEWDKVTIAFGYQDFPEGTDEDAALDAILDEAHANGLLYISDNDARPRGGAHPHAHLWDYGTEVVDQLGHIMEVREMALKNFGENTIKSGEPLALLEDKLVPIYLFHRYQVEGTAKLIGGLDYNYKLKGDTQPYPTTVPKKVQEKALNQLLATLSPEALALPESILNVIPPRPNAISSTRELFRGNTGPTLDALSIAQTGASVPLGMILNPQRANRLVEYGAREGNLNLREVITALNSATWDQPIRDDYKGSIQQVVNLEYVKHLIGLHASGSSGLLTKAIVQDQLSGLMLKLNQVNSHPSRLMAASMIQNYLDNPEEFEAPSTPSAPPGSPIGSGSGHAHLSCDF